MARFTSGHAERTIRWVTARPLARSTYTACYRTDAQIEHLEKRASQSNPRPKLGKRLAIKPFIILFRRTSRRLCHFGTRLDVIQWGLQEQRSGVQFVLSVRTG